MHQNIPESSVEINDSIKDGEGQGLGRNGVLDSEEPGREGARAALPAEDLEFEDDLTKTEVDSQDFLLIPSGSN